jgi:hypothetical protein
MEQQLRDSSGACIYCGEISILKDVPCDCQKAKEARVRHKAVEGGRSRLEESCAPDAPGWREQITAEEYGELLLLLEIISRELLREIAVKLSNGTKVIFKSGGDIGIERKEGPKSVTLCG